jgi:hypothetical protein
MMRPMEDGASGLCGLKFFEPLRAALEELHDQKAHPNRNLHYDQYLCLLLLAFFNPAIRGLRQLVKLPEFPRTAGNLGLRHTSLGSFSEASSVFDPEPLRRIFLELSAETRALNGPPRLGGLPAELKVLVADATTWKLLPRITPLLYEKPPTRSRKGELKGYFVFNVLDQVPTAADFTIGQADERQFLQPQLVPGALYVLDRGYQSSLLFAGILAAQSSFVARLRYNTDYTVLSAQPLDATAVASGVSSDQVVQLGEVDRPLRLVHAKVMSVPSRNLDPKCKRGKHAAPSCESREHELILLTDRLDLKAEEIVALYAQRWQIELFFRWFKCVLGCRHLFAETANGMALQVYAALIATLLVVIYTQRKPTKQLLFLLQMYLLGVAEWRSVQEEIDRSKPLPS